MDIQEIKELKIAKVKILKSLNFSTRYFFKNENGRKFVMNYHHELIINILERVLRGELTKVMINLAPRYSKTEIAVKQFISDALAINASSKFIHLSYSDDLALDNSEAIKDIVTSDYYQKLFPEVQIKKDSKSKKKWYTTAGGGVYATSASGQVTGFGAGKVDDEEKEDLKEFLNDIENKKEFGGAIIIDDPIKPDDAESNTKRDKVNNKFESTIRNRVNSRKTPIIIIMQRLHDEDLCGYLLDLEGDKKDGGEWEVLSLPCITEDGEALWEFKHTIEELYKLKRLNEDVFMKQYMQDPQSPKGLFLTRNNLNYFDTINEGLEYTKLGFIDTADEGTDFMAFGVFYIIAGKVYLVECLYSQESATRLEDRIVSIIDKHGLHETWIETNQHGSVFINNLQLKTTHPIRPKKHTISKMKRMLEQSSTIEDHFQFMKERDVEYSNMFTHATRVTKSGGSNQKDDGLDMMSFAAYVIRARYSELLNDSLE